MSSIAICGFYKQILKYAGLTTSEDGFVMLPAGKDELKNATVDGRKLVMPTTTRLREFCADTQIVFNPLKELAWREESGVFRSFKRALMIRLNVNYAQLVAHLLAVATTPAKQTQLTPEQTAFLVKLDVDDKAAVKWAEMLGPTVKARPDDGFICVTLRKGGEYGVGEGRKKYKQVAITFFPHYEGISNKKERYDKLAEKYRKSFMDTIELIFPEIKTEDAYSIPCDAACAPRLEALLKATGQLASRINELVDLFESVVPALADLRFDMSWADTADVLDAFQAELFKIPTQTSNDPLLDKTPPAKTAPSTRNDIPPWDSNTPPARTSTIPSIAPPPPAVRESRPGVTTVGDLFRTPHLANFATQQNLNGQAGYNRPSNTYQTRYGPLDANTMVVTIDGLMPLHEAMRLNLNFSPAR